MVGELTEQRWKSRPVLAAALRVAAFVTPVAAAIGAAVLVSNVVPRPDGLLMAALWWLGVTAVSTIVLAAVERVARRLLPLAALLRLCMLFPDRVPSRFSLALRAGSVADLRRRLEEPGATPAQAAATVLALLGALSAHDRSTRGHCERVRAYTELLATELRLSERDRDLLRWASLLHDIGKVSVASGLLNKPSAPTPDEWEELRAHPTTGARLVAPLKEWLGDWGDTIEQHHERWDGAGYPRGLAGGDICWGARIVAVADAFETMTAYRPYARPVSPTAARRELAFCAGSHFDPDVVRAFLNVSIGRLRLAMGPMAWLGQIPVIGALEDASVRVAIAGAGHPSAAGVLGGAAATGVAALLVSSGVAPDATGTEAAAADAAPVVAYEATPPAGPGLEHRPFEPPEPDVVEAVLAHTIRARAAEAAAEAVTAPAGPPASPAPPAPAPGPEDGAAPAAPTARAAPPPAPLPAAPAPPAAPDRDDVARRDDDGDARDDDDGDDDERDNGPDLEFGGTPPGQGGTPPGRGGTVPGRGPDHVERDEDGDEDD